VYAESLADGDAARAQFGLDRLDLVDDAVVVVEPSRIVADVDQGMRALYVALTRSTQRLSVVHHDDLPEPLR
jgi:hypothetical protein